MKGIISSVIVLMAFLSTLMMVLIFVSNVQESRDLVNSNAVGDRIFYKYAAIEYSILRIMEKDLTGVGFNHKLTESGAFNTVMLNITIPSQTGNFSQDMSRYERFAETYLNQTNLAVDLNLSYISDCFPMTILPYNISYGTVDGSQSNCGFGSGQRDLKITPNGNSSLINSMDILIVANRTRINPSSASWTPGGDCTGGTLNWTIRVVGNGSSNYGPVTNMIDPDGKCVFRINENVTGNKVIQINNKPNNGDPDATMVVTVQPGFNNVTFRTIMNLTDVPGKLRIGLAPQSLKVRETLFKIERNDTVSIQ